MKIKEIEAQLKDEAEEKGREIIATAIQRCAADHAAETTVSVVTLPNDEMKGRIMAARAATSAHWRPLPARSDHRRYPRNHHRFQL